MENNYIVGDKFGIKKANIGVIPKTIDGKIISTNVNYNNQWEFKNACKDTEYNCYFGDSTDNIDYSGRLQNPNDHSVFPKMIEITTGRYGIELHLEPTDNPTSLNFTYTLIKDGNTKVIDKTSNLTSSPAPITAADVWSYSWRTIHAVSP